MKRIAIATLTLLGLAFPLASKTLASPIDDPNNIDWTSIRGYDSKEFNEYFNKQKAEGFRVVDLEVDEINGKANYSAIFQKNTDQRAWASLRDLSDEEFSQRWNEFKDKGYRLIDQEAYTLNGKRLYAGVWEENKGNLGWVSYRNVDGEEFGKRFKQYSDQGFRMIDTEAYSSGGKTLYSAIWIKNTDNVNWVALRDMSGSAYAERFKSLSEQGYRQLDFESYVRDGEQQYAAIWVKNNGGAWVSRHNMTATQYANLWKTYADEGYRLVDFEAYETPQGTRYAGIWRQNGEKLSWKPKKAVDDVISDYQKQFNIPGISVAIAQNGKLVYARGFGYTDIEQQKAAHSGTVYRTASVAKLITRALTLRLEDQNVLSIDKPTRTYVSILPQQHTHTVRQLLEHKSGIRHYRGSKRENCEVPNNPAWRDSSNTQYATSTQATELFRDDPLMFSPGAKTCYSTHAYTVVGAAIEGASKKSFASIFDREITQGLGLSTLRPEMISQANSERATLYRDKTSSAAENVPAARDNISWKTGGGGLETSSVDLARFGMKLLPGQSFLSKKSHDDLWGGRKTIQHSGAQNGANSYLRIHSEKGTVIAVLSNQSLELAENDPNQDDAGIGKLTNAISNIVLKD
ncbi:serine hydrolase [Cyanobacteria bacterium FACHB-63]|nr:serine hydrolase [Cyanobacteria bacterium FACHB-63]